MGNLHVLVMEWHRRHQERTVDADLMRRLVAANVAAMIGSDPMLAETGKANLEYHKARHPQEWALLEQEDQS